MIFFKRLDNRKDIQPERLNSRKDIQSVESAWSICLTPASYHLSRGIIRDVKRAKKKTNKKKKTIIVFEEHCYALRICKLSVKVKIEQTLKNLYPLSLTLCFLLSYKLKKGELFREFTCKYGLLQGTNWKLLVNVPRVLILD